MIRRRPWRLSSRLLAAQVTILGVVLLSGLPVSMVLLQHELAGQYRARARLVARQFAAEVGQQHLIGAPLTARPPAHLQELANTARRTTGATSIALLPLAAPYQAPQSQLAQAEAPGGSPPTPSPAPAAAVHYARASATLVDSLGRPAGRVTVAFATPSVWSAGGHELRLLGLWTVLALIVGTGASFLVARLIKRETLGLEPPELTRLVHEKDAVLHGINDGVVSCTAEGEIRFANEAARRSLRLPQRCVGRPLWVLLQGQRLREALTSPTPTRDELVVAGDRVLVVNRMPVQRAGRDLGWVLTIRDRTEWEGLLRELDGLTGVTEALRAQAHEFSNHLHTLVGLIELGRYREAAELATNVSIRRDATAEDWLAQIGQPTVVALLLAKLAVASERGVALQVTPDTCISGELLATSQVITVLGNLIENAVDAALTPPDGADPCHYRPSVTVRLVSRRRDLLIQVSDSGAGVPAHLRESVFADGFSTKPSASGARRGVGLALVRQIADRFDGRARVSGAGGSRFEVFLRRVVDPGGPAADRGAPEAAAAGVLAVGYR